ncbi:MAG: hypothetical protein K2H63_06100, partial [Paramuribaculum sp.]|nr:hypothetical protein [Paramuribaculum sp.]
MTLNDRHIKNSSFTPSPALTALKKITRVVGIVLATIIGLLLWAIVKPIFRGVGWVISLVTALLIIFWLITL